MKRLCLLLLLSSCLAPASLALEDTIAVPGVEQGQPTQLRTNWISSFAMRLTRAC
jgi:hypothetical protein